MTVYMLEGAYTRYILACHPHVFQPSQDRFAVVTASIFRICTFCHGWDICFLNSALSSSHQFLFLKLSTLMKSTGRQHWSGRRCLDLSFSTSFVMMARGDHYSEGSVLSIKLGRACLCLCFHSTKAVERITARTSINDGTHWSVREWGPWTFRKLDVRPIPNPQQTLPVATAKAMSSDREWIGFVCFDDVF